MSQLEPFEHHYSNQYQEVFGCCHQNRQYYSDKVICKECGIFLNNPNTRVYKTLKMKFNAYFNPIKVLQSILSEGLPKGPAKHRQQIIEFILQASERLNLSLNTSFLAINYIDEYFSKITINENQTYLFVATALMLAAKAQELDERVPFISKLKRYASMTNHPEINQYSIQEYKFAERSLIQTMEWKLQRVTLLDRIEAILSFGVIDDDDSLGQQQQKENKDISHQQHIKLRDLQENQILYYVKEVESKYADIALQIIKDDHLYFETDQTILALSCVAYLRKKAGLLNIWSQQLQCLTGISAQKISSSVSQIMTLIAKSKSFKTITTLQMNPQEIYYQPLIPNNTLTTINTNHLNNRAYPYETKRQSYGDIMMQNSKLKIYQSQSTVQLVDIQKQNHLYKHTNFTTTTNYSYLNENPIPHTHMVQQFAALQNHELDKKYEQVHKVSASMFRPMQ
ncbi:unnamed protein product [Paramecium pentaurelia]|uniref:Cyclin N-terminal domain-containing protein n=1 Tax=Paramecium pentaurelia TaxID=43138 RepID=A0A8S1Y529_9CILI|nr:unnamed protein product [Paramecium pentaurelia]